MKDELEAYLSSPSATQKAERIRRIVTEAEAAGIRADPDIDDADLLLGLDFRIVPTAFLKRLSETLKKQSVNYRTLVKLMAREVPKERLEAIYREELEEVEAIYREELEKAGV